MRKFGVRKPGFWLEPSQMLTVNPSCILSGPQSLVFKIEGVALNQSRETGGRCRLFILQGFYILISYQHVKIKRFYRKAQISASNSWLMRLPAAPLKLDMDMWSPQPLPCPTYSLLDTEAAYQLPCVI